MMILLWTVRLSVVATGANADTVALSDSQFSRSMLLSTGSGADFVDLQASQVPRTAAIFVGGGDDNVRIQDSTTVRRLAAYAGTGTDSVQVGSDTTVTKHSVTRQAENSTVDTDLANERLNDSETGALTRSANANTFFDSLLTDSSGSGTNTAPVTSGITDVIVAQNAVDSVIDLRSAFDDQQDADLDLSFSIQSNTHAKLFTDVSIDQGTGQLTLDSSALEIGATSVTVLATDTGGLTVSSSFLVTVTPTANTLFVSSSSTAGAVVGNALSENVTGEVVYELERPSQEALLQLNSDDHLSGAAASKVVLIEYFDFQCPACATYHPVIQQIKQDFADDLVVVSRHLPITSVHPNAARAAVASEAAAEQGMFDEMIDLLFTNQAEWAGATDPTSLFEGYSRHPRLWDTGHRAHKVGALGIRMP